MALLRSLSTGVMTLITLSSHQPQLTFNSQNTKPKKKKFPKMASIYTCIECGTNLNLSTTHLYPQDFYFEAGNKGTLSFSSIDSTKFKFEEEDKIRPFFETVNYWGIQRKRTKIKCNSCGCLVGYIYDDGQPSTISPGQFGLGPSQAIPRAPRYRFKTKALRIASET